jgi:thiamine biosynthesis lipoprotein
VGYKKLILDKAGLSVRFAVDGMRLDLGGIAKGYAVDKAVEENMAVMKEVVG